MALVTMSSRCFNTIQTFFEAVKTGDTSSSKVMLKSIKQDGLLLQREALALCDRLKQAEEEHQKQDEDLTRQINDLYQEQIQQEKRKQELETKKSSLTNEKERCSQRRQVASRRKQQAEQEKREAEERYDELEKYWWIPIVGQILAVRELIENNEKKAKEASRDVDRYESDIKRAESEISRANSGILEVSMISQIDSKCEQLNDVCPTCIISSIAADLNNLHPRDTY